MKNKRKRMILIPIHMLQGNEAKTKHNLRTYLVHTKIFTSSLGSVDPNSPSFCANISLHCLRTILIMD